MNDKNGIGESKPKQRRRQGESAPELPVGRAYAIESVAVGKVLISSLVFLRNICVAVEGIVSQERKFYFYR